MKNMKKVLAVMTAVSAMAAQASAFAATTVGETDASSIITFTQAVKNEEGAVTTGNSIAVDAMPSDIIDGEVTLLVLDYATVETAVADDDILYIDQGTYENSTNPFAGKALGLKASDIVAAAEAQFAIDLAADETLETKTYSYPVKLGYYNADEFAIATASVDVTVAVDAATGTEITFVFGDVDGSYDPATMASNPALAITAADAGSIIAIQAGGSLNAGAEYDMGDLITDVNGKAVVFGDVDGSYDPATMASNPALAITAADAGSIIAIQAGGSLNAGAEYDMGDLVTLTIPASN